MASTKKISAPTTPTIKPTINKNSPTNGSPRPQLTRSQSSDTLSQTSSNSSRGKKSRVSPHIIPTQKNDFSHVKSRVGSLDNISHIPKGGEIKIFSDKPDFSNVGSRIRSLENIDHIPKGGDKKILSIKPDFTNVGSRVGSLENINHTPKGGDKKILSIKPDFSKVGSRIGSLENINHTPKGGDKKIESIKIDFSNITPRVGSLDNIYHTPKGGDIKIKSVKVDFSKVHSRPRVGSLDNIDHVPGGGEKYVPIKIPVKVPLSSVKSKVGSFDNIQHTPCGGDFKIFSRKLSYRDVSPKIRVRSYSNASSIDDNDRSDLVYSPISSLALDESLEVNSPPSDPLADSNTPLTEVLPPIMENLHSEEANDDNYNDEPGYLQASEPPKILQDSQLNDTDLDFKVNVQRKTLLLANESNLPRALSTFEIPPDNSVSPTKPELTADQKKVYDSSWL
ncbi:6074_t:CDS:2 [Cetraspora pellucida]|uniref:Microtubule-associated protein n=1 Tax=Cetraspora pellucida TaxID=1433469 RepID=A0A9N9E2Y9_9GLOM|nr:6074_t:CDS:2 [Cetraspora pellucida]